MANLCFVIAIVVVATCYSLCEQIQNIANINNFLNQILKNDNKEAGHLDENKRGVQEQWLLREDLKEGLKALINVKEELNKIENIIKQDVKKQQIPVQPSFLSSQIQKPESKLHIYNPNIFFPEIIERLENNTSAYDDWPKRRHQDKNQQSNFLTEIIEKVQNDARLFDRDDSVNAWNQPEDGGKIIVKRMAQQETKAKKAKKIKRARDKRRQKQRRRIRHLRRIGKLPGKKGDGGKNKVKKVYKRYRKGNSTHSFRYNLTMTPKPRVRSKKIKKDVIPRWVPDGGNSTENVTSEELGKNDIQEYDASIVDESEESSEESSEDGYSDDTGEGQSSKDDDEEYSERGSESDENSDQGNKAKTKKPNKSKNKKSNKGSK